MAKIGFIGTGIMGHPMALNLQKAGHSLFLSAHHDAEASWVLVIATIIWGKRAGKAGGARSAAAAEAAPA